MRINITGCLLALLCAPAYCLGQTDPDTWIRSAEVQAVIRQLSEKYGITGVTRPYQDTGQRVISDIEPILKWLDTTYGARNWTVSASAREFYKSFRVTLGDSKSHDRLEIRLRVCPSFEGAEIRCTLDEHYSPAAELQEECVFRRHSWRLELQRIPRRPSRKFEILAEECGCMDGLSICD